MAFTKFRLRRDTLTNWTTVNPVLLEGEFVIVTPDTGTGKGKVKIKQGDGVTAFNSLPYAYNEAEIDINVLGLAFEDWAVTTPVPSAETALSNIVTGANSGTLWSNLKAFLKSTITTGKIVNNLISTTTGLALDSTQGKALKDMIDTTNNNLVSQDVSSLFVNGYANLSHAAIICKSGKMVALSLYLVSIGTVTSTTTILTLPVGYRPSAKRYCKVDVTAGGSVDETPYTIRVLVNEDGTVQLGHEYSHKATHPYIMGTLVFSI